MRKDYSVKTIVGIATLICATHVGAAGGTPPPIPAKGCDVAQHKYPPPGGNVELIKTVSTVDFLYVTTVASAVPNKDNNSLYHVQSHP